MHITSGDLWAGAEMQLYTLAKEINRDDNIELSIILFNHGILEEKLLGEDIRTNVVDESALNSLQVIRQLLRHIRIFRPAIIHTHGFKENILGSICAFLCGRIFTVRTLHGAPENTETNNSLRQKVIRLADRFCMHYLQRRVVLVSRDLSMALSDSIPVRKCMVIENGVDLEGILACHNKQDSSLRGSHQGFRVGLAGRLVPVKRVDLFIQTASYLREHAPELNVRFHVYGDGPLRYKLEQLNERLGTTGIVSFDGHSDDIYKKLSELDALMITSDHEGLPMILLEAMALRIPVIAHASGGIPEVLDGGKYGVLVSDHSAAGYARALIDLAKREDREQLSLDAFNHISRHYTARLNAERYIDLYHQLSSGS
jgi:glycosyltransferase involved in cell wall biosynthesis